MDETSKLESNIGTSRALVSTYKVKSGLSFGKNEMLTRLNLLGFIFNKSFSFNKLVAKSKCTCPRNVAWKTRHCLSGMQLISSYRLPISPLVYYGLLIYVLFTAESQPEDG